MKNLHAATRRISLSFALVAVVPLGVVAVSPAASAAPGGTKLEPGQKLVVGQTLKSPNGAYKLYMQGDGNLVLYGPKGALWSARTTGQGKYAVLQADGNFVVYDAGKKPLWYSGTWDDPGAELALQDDGNLVLYRQGKPVWSTNTYVRDTSLTPGEKLVGGATIVSGDDRYALLMQGDGNLVLYGPGGAALGGRHPGCGQLRRHAEGR